MNGRSKRPNSISRRQFGKTAAAAFGAAAGFHFIPSRAWGRLEKPTLAGIGIGGKGLVDIQESDKVGFEVVAFQDAASVDATLAILDQVVAAWGASWASDGRR